MNFRCKYRHRRSIELYAFCPLIRYVTMQHWPLTFWPWIVVIHDEPRGQPCQHVWKPHAYSFELWVITTPLKMRMRPLRMRSNTWLIRMGSKANTFLKYPTPICLFTIQLLLEYDDDKGSFTLERFQCWSPWWRKCLVRDLVTPTFDFLTLNSCHTWLATWPTLPSSLKTLRLFLFDLWVITFPVGYHSECVCGHRA